MTDKLYKQIYQIDKEITKISGLISDPIYVKAPLQPGVESRDILEAPNFGMTVNRRNFLKD